jgi:hypothetical protein
MFAALTPDLYSSPASASPQNSIQRSTNDGATDKRVRLPWGKKAVPLKTTSLFSKSKHSEEWHHSIDATAGVLHPSDPKLPYSFLRNHTDTYLKKKGKVNQADADIRMSILIASHDARDIAVAAAAHAMTAQSIRALLHADLNVMHGSYWGLKTWLQCLIAANNGNPASVTDLEALWARKLLPFATQGPRAAEWYLAGACRALRDMDLPNTDFIPEYKFMRRAIGDYSTQLEGFRMRNEWTAASEAVLWMVELAKTSPVVTPPGHFLPEHILDSQFPIWRVWTYWKPNLERIRLYARSNIEKLAVMSDLVALEGPDMITGAENTLREGLLVRFDGTKALLRWRGMIIEVPDRSKQSLRNTLERITRLLETTIAASGPGHMDMFGLFRDYVISRPVTTDNLYLLEATFRIPYTPENDIYSSVRNIHSNRGQLGGEHISSIQNLLCALDNESSAALRDITLQDWFRQGIENCVQECQEAVREHIDKRLSWAELILEYHAFCTLVKASEHHWPLAYQTIKVHPLWPSSEHMKIIAEIYSAVQAHQSQVGSQAVATERKVDGADNTIKPNNTLPIVSKNDQNTLHPWEVHIEEYCVARVLGGKSIGISSERVIKAILHLWKSTSEPHVDNDRRELAVLVATIAGTDLIILGCKCLADIASGQHHLGPGPWIKSLLAILQKYRREMPQAIIELTNLLASNIMWGECWKYLLCWWIHQQSQPGLPNGQTILDYSLRAMKTAQWLPFIGDIESLSTGLTFSHSCYNTKPPILSPGLLAWKTRVSEYSDTLTRLEAVLENNLSAVYCLLTSYEGSNNLLAILYCLQKSENTPVEKLVQKVVGNLSRDGKNAIEIRNCLLDLRTATPDVVDTCLRIWDAKDGWLDIPKLPVPSSQKIARKQSSAYAETPSQLSEAQPDTAKTEAVGAESFTRRQAPPAVVEVMVAGLLTHNDDIADQDAIAIASVADVLGIRVEQFTDSDWKTKLAEAAKFWEGIEAEILAESARLQTLQKALKAKDRKGTTALLKELGVPSESLLDDEIAGLPAGVMDAVEKVGETEVEISFPLNAMTDLQRGAMGIPDGANTLLLRLSIHKDDGTPPSFCLHFNNDDNLGALRHEPADYTSSEAQRHLVEARHALQNSRPLTEYWDDPGSLYENSCTSKQTAFTWQLHRIILTQLKAGVSGIIPLHKFVKDRMQDMGDMCISCGASHNAATAQLRRATPCSLLTCARLWYNLPLDVRVPEIRNDIYVVDLMLTSVYAAAMSGRPELLPACPIRSTEAVKTILNALPKLTLISHAVNISAVLKPYHKDAELLISWACVQHRGYIATAKGLCKVPTLPTGTHQFVLANASPKLESEYISKLPKHTAKTTVLFHGTTFDRLPAILAQGLRVCSGTSLQRTGAAHGQGIYLADEPATSLTYSSTTTSWRNSGLANMKLLFGCEVVGDSKSVSRGIHLVKDEASVMVRYIFLLTGNASAPIANHLVTPMASAMRALRTGAV